MVVLVALAGVAYADGYPREPGPCDDVTACEAACKAGKVAMCAWGGVLAMRDKDTLVYDRVARGRAMLDKACAKGDAESCWYVARIADPGPRAGAAERAKAAANYERACNKQHVRACLELAAILSLPGDDKAKRAATAASKKGSAILERRCAKKEAAACTWLASLYEEGAALPQDAAKATEYRERACQITSGAACPLPRGKCRTDADCVAVMGCCGVWSVVPVAEKDDARCTSKRDCPDHKASPQPTAVCRNSVCAPASTP
jgi:TPR repeat protein